MFMLNMMILMIMMTLTWWSSSRSTSLSQSSHHNTSSIAGGSHTNGEGVNWYHGTSGRTAQGLRRHVDQVFKQEVKWHLLTVSFFFHKSPSITYSSIQFKHPQWNWHSLWPLNLSQEKTDGFGKVRRGKLCFLSPFVKFPSLDEDVNWGWHSPQHWGPHLSPLSEFRMSMCSWLGIHLAWDSWCFLVPRYLRLFSCRFNHSSIWENCYIPPLANYNL